MIYKSPTREKCESTSAALSKPDSLQKFSHESYLSQIPLQNSVQIDGNIIKFHQMESIHDRSQSQTQT